MISDKRFNFITGLLSVARSNTKDQEVSKEQFDKIVEMCKETIFGMRFHVEEEQPKPEEETTPDANV